MRSPWPGMADGPRLVLEARLRDEGKVTGCGLSVASSARAVTILYPVTAKRHTRGPLRDVDKRDEAGNRSVADRGVRWRERGSRRGGAGGFQRASRWSRLRRCRSSTKSARCCLSRQPAKPVITPAYHRVRNPVITVSDCTSSRMSRPPSAAPRSSSPISPSARPRLRGCANRSGSLAKLTRLPDGRKLARL